MGLPIQDFPNTNRHPPWWQRWGFCYLVREIITSLPGLVVHFQSDGRVHIRYPFLKVLTAFQSQVLLENNDNCHKGTESKDMSSSTGGTGKDCSLQMV